MFSPEMILGMLGMSPEDAARLQAAVPAAWNALREAEARLVRIENALTRIEARMQTPDERAAMQPAEMLLPTGDRALHLMNGGN